MSRTQRIGNRLQRFYKHWQKDSLIFSLLHSVSKQIDEIDEEITALMKAHWVDTAKEAELSKLGILVGAERLPEENDAHFRVRLKNAVNEYKGGGTVSAILESVRALLGAKSDGDIQIVENPRVEASAEFIVQAGDTWTLGSNSIVDEQPSSLIIVVEGRGQVDNPQVTNMSTGEFIAFKGKLKSGEQLVIKDDKAYIDEKEVTENVSPQKMPRLLRKGSNWKYSEALLERIAVFDTAKFDEHTFAVEVPTVKIRFDWIRSQPATFVVKIKSNALGESGLTESYVERVKNSMKATGVNGIIEVQRGD
jgi:hypothetical protein